MVIQGNMRQTRKIRKGKDIVVRWSLYRNENGERVPFAIDATAVLKVQTPYGTITATEVTIEGNVVSWTFRGKDQEHLGYYGLELVQNDGEKGMVTVDTCTAFALVAHSCEETPDVGGDVVTDAVMLEGEVAFAPLVIELGGESYDDTELRDAIADLQEKDKATDTQLAEQSAKLTELSAEVGKVSDEVEKKADEQGYYPNLSVGMADNLLGHAPAVEREIVFDATASKDNDVTEDVARIEAIKGNSLVWNQSINLAPSTQTISGITYVINSDGTITMSGVATDNSYIEVLDNKAFIGGHKYALTGGFTSGNSLATYFLAINKGGSYTDIASPAVIFAAETTKANKLFIRIASGVDANGFKVYPKLYDLTQMFGAGNEPTTIDEFYSRIPSGVDINAYNEGEVIHNYATGLKSVGFNAWDEQWEKGKFSTTDGTNQGADNTMRMANKVAVLPNSTYYMKSSVDTWVLFYDKDGKVIEGYSTGLEKYQNTSKVKNSSFVTPPNAAYLRAYFNQYFASASTYQNDVCLHLAHTGYRNGEYEPYWEESIGLPNTLVFADGMKSAGSARDEVYYDRYAKKWRVIKRIGVVDLGTLNWSAFTTMNGLSRTQAVLSDFIGGSEGQVSNILCTKFATVKSTASMIGSESTGIFGFTNNRVFVLFKDTDYTDVASFKASLQGVMLYYELAEPIESDLDDYLPATMSAEERAKVLQFIYRVSDFGTEQMLTDEGVKSSALVADIVYGVDAFRTLVNLRKRVAALEK